MSEEKKKENLQQTNTPSGEIGIEALPVTTYWADVVRRFRKNKIAVVGLIMLTIIIVLCAGAPLFTDYDPIVDMNLLDKLQPPGSEGHMLGTDHLGRDIWSRLLYGGRTSVLTGLSVALITAVSRCGHRPVQRLLWRHCGNDPHAPDGYYDVLPLLDRGHCHHGGLGIQPAEHHFGLGRCGLAPVRPPDPRPGAGGGQIVGRCGIGPGRLALAICASSLTTSCPTAWAPSSSRPRWLWAAPFFLPPA